MSSAIVDVSQIKINISRYDTLIPKNIPVSLSVLHDLEYNNTLSLYSKYKNVKRRSSSERNTLKVFKE